MGAAGCLGVLVALHLADVSVLIMFNPSARLHHSVLDTVVDHLYE